ncbi:MAG TPA: NAD-dependent epimerase/dehydratase family protein [Candidatus Sulfotelmatobacter sp.]|nr:NAD-dependent epimerase/dehydratase family protein [Candidatus Sulfotelmatobacter sp.]
MSDAGDRSSHEREDRGPSLRALVTGGAGFIGSHVVDALVEDGAIVEVIDDLSRGRREQVNTSARLHVLDITSPALAEVVIEFSPDVVFHHAAQMNLRASMSDPLLDARINVLGSVNLLTACVRAQTARVVFASTGGAVYGDTEVIPTPEDHRPEPMSMYGAAKLAAEEYGFTFARNYPIDFVALRYANVYGPRQDPHGEAGVVAIFSERLLSGNTAAITGDGCQTRDFVYVEDVVRANLLAAQGSVTTGAYNIGTGRETDINEIYRLIAQACGSDRPAQHIDAKPGEQRRSCLDIRRASERLGWTPTADLASGLARTVEYFRN